MTEDVQPDPETAANELRPELQPIAEKYGRELFDTALRIASFTAALDQLLHRTRTSATLHALVNVVVASAGDLNMAVIEAKGWELDNVMACIEEIGQAHRNSAPRIKVVH